MQKHVSVVSLFLLHKSASENGKQQARPARMMKAVREAA